MLRKRGLLAATLLGGAVLALGNPALAGERLTSGNGLVTIGVTQMGSLFNGILGDPSGEGITGIALSGVGDALTPGCLCEGWGASANGVVVRSGGNGGNSNISLDSTATDGDSFFTSNVHATSLPDLVVSQHYKRSASGSLFEDVVTITNAGAGVLMDVRYTRVMDWDVPPTPFAEEVTINRAGSTALLFSNDQGFASPDPLSSPPQIVGGTTNTDFVDSGPADHGAFFTFAFGNLGVGESKTFSIFYGATESEAAAFAALGTVGAEVYSFGQQAGDPVGGTPGTFIFAFKGVGGVVVPPPSAVPEPGAMAMLAGMGLSGLGLLLRRRNRK
jgi:type IV pilus assembly protein PilY1